MHFIRDKGGTSLKTLETKMSYEFKDKQLLNTAMTHSSAVNELKTTSNQRLEFLGDSVLQLVISTYIYERMPRLNEGALSKLRSLIVCADSLYIAASEIGLSKYLILGKGEEVSGGRQKKNIIADAFESLIGAVYLDGGFGMAEKFVLRLLKNVISQAVKGTLTYDYKTMLQEYAQAKDMGELSYELVKIDGPEHDQTFFSCVVLDGKRHQTACGHNRKQSEQNAAENALRELKIID